MKAYPLETARVGSIFRNNKIATNNVIHNNITEFRYGGKGNTFMSGNSRYVHTEHMNKGSFGISGSYGVSGISKVTGAVSGYVGNSVSKASKTTSINYNAYISAGVEYLKVESLSILEFIESLESNPRKQILDVLDNYNALNDKLDSLKLNIFDCLENNSEQAQEVIRLLEEWYKSIDRFLKSNGEGIIVAIHWGALGYASLEFEQSDRNSKWIYGGDAEFSYAGPGASVSVKAAYQGSNQEENADAKAKVKTDYLGEAITKILEEWRKLLEGKAFKELANLDVLSKAPDLKVPDNIKPKIPDFIKPDVSAKKEVKEKINKQSDSSKRKSNAVASAFSKKKNNNPNEIELKEFVAESENELNTDAIAAVAPDSEVDFSDITNKKANDSKMNQEFAMGGIKGNSPHLFMANTDKIQDKLLNKDTELAKSFIPLGAIICNWTELFPWLSMGIDNRLGNLEEARLIVKWRTMIQDFLALSAIYYTADSVGIKLPGLSSALQIGDSFSHGVSILQENSNDDYNITMETAFSELSDSAKVIFRKWDEVKSLRKAELGLGLIYENEKSISLIYYPDKTLRFESCEFNPDTKNFEAFSSFIKLLPIILPDGRVTSFGKDGILMFFERKKEIKIVVTDVPKPDMATEYSYIFVKDFEISPSEYLDEHNGVLYTNTVFPIILDQQDYYFKNEKYKLNFFPIPLSAAKGVQKWRGGGLGVSNLSSFEDLQKSFLNVKKELSQLKNFTFTSESFEDLKVTADTGLSELNVRENYIGIVPEQKDLMNIFNN